MKRDAWVTSAGRAGDESTAPSLAERLLRRCAGWRAHAGCGHVAFEDGDLVRDCYRRAPRHGRADHLREAARKGVPRVEDVRGSRLPPEVRHGSTGHRPVAP